MRRRPKSSFKQPTPDDLLQELMEFVRGKFYAGDSVQFAKDRRRLLDWVVLWPAEWLNERGATIPGDRYRKIFMGVCFDALDHMAAKVTYRPAWLRQVIQSHFAMHGEEIYEEAKSMRNLVEHSMIIAGKAVGASPDPVQDLAKAKRLLEATARPRKPVSQAPVKSQLTLL